MPGPVSDSYDPEFSTDSNANDVRKAIEGAVQKVGKTIGSEPKDIVEVVQGQKGTARTLTLTEQELRVIRFAMSRALESI